LFISSSLRGLYMQDSGRQRLLAGLDSLFREERG
jgi:hypothetical protein